MLLPPIVTCRSLGATVHEMATTKPPWGTLVPEAAMFQIGIGKSFPSLPEEVFEPLNDFYRKCLIRSVPCLYSKNMHVYECNFGYSCIFRPNLMVNTHRIYVYHYVLLYYVPSYSLH